MADKECCFFRGAVRGYDRWQQLSAKQFKGKQRHHTIVMVVHVASGNLQLPLQVLNIFLDGYKLVDVGFVLVECSFLLFETDEDTWIDIEPSSRW